MDLVYIYKVSTAIKKLPIKVASFFYSGYLNYFNISNKTFRGTKFSPCLRYDIIVFAFLLAIFSICFLSYTVDYIIKFCELYLFFNMLNKLKSLASIIKSKYSTGKFGSISNNFNTLPSFI